MGDQYHKPGSKRIADIQRPSGPDASSRAVGHQAPTGLPDQLRHRLRAARLHTGQHFVNALNRLLRMRVRIIFSRSCFVCILNFRFFEHFKLVFLGRVDSIFLNQNGFS